jgi:hypothetical protein
MKKIIKAILLFIIVLTGFLGFYYMNRVGLDGPIELGADLVVSPMMLIITAVVLTLILITNVFAWIAIIGAAVLLILYYAFDITMIKGQQMMAIYLLLYGLVDIWLTTGDKKRK